MDNATQWTLLIVGMAAGAVIFIGGLYLTSRLLQGREPYSSFMRLEIRRKLRFFRLLVADPRVPRAVKVLPFLVAAYVVFPIDIIPVLGYLDDVGIIIGALALIVRLTPRVVIDDLLTQANVDPA